MNIAAYSNAPPSRAARNGLYNIHALACINNMIEYLLVKLHQITTSNLLNQSGCHTLSH